MPKEPSPLGTVVESALVARFVRHRDPVQYLATFRTTSGTVFAAERVSLGQINLWIPEQEAARRVAETAGLYVKRSVPWPMGRDGKYGRISSLKTISDLSDVTLYKVQVTTAGEALQVAEALA